MPRSDTRSRRRPFWNHRDRDLGGMFSSIDQLNGVADPAVVNQLKQGAYLSGFHVFGAEIIGPQVGAALRKQALLATLYSLPGCWSICGSASS